MSEPPIPLPPYWVPTTHPVSPDRVHPLTNTDILTYVFQNFASTLDHSHPNYADLVRFSRVSRPWNEASNKFVYRHVVVRDGDRSVRLVNLGKDENISPSNEITDPIAHVQTRLTTKYARVLTVHDHDEDTCPLKDLISESEHLLPAVHSLILRGTDIIRLYRDCRALRYLVPLQLIAYVGFGNKTNQVKTSYPDENETVELFERVFAFTFVLGSNLEIASKQVEWLFHAMRLAPNRRFVLSPVLYNECREMHGSAQDIESEPEDPDFGLDFGERVALAKALLTGAALDAESQREPRYEPPALILFDSPLLEDPSFREIMWVTIVVEWLEKVGRYEEGEGQVFTRDEKLGYLREQVSIGGCMEKKMTLDSLLEFHLAGGLLEELVE